MTVITKVDDVMSCVLENDNVKLSTLLKNGMNNVFDALLPRNSKLVENKTAAEFVQTTPLFAAVKTGNLEAAKMLLDNGANLKKIVSAPNGVLSSPYELCLLSSDNEDLSRILKEYAQDSGLISVTSVVRSSKSKSLQYGVHNGKKKGKKTATE